MGLSISEHGVAISHGVHQHGEFSIRKLDFAPVSGGEQMAFIKGWVTRNRLKNADCYYVLNKNEYALELIESPPVASEELTEAVRWRLKDLIQTPIEETAIDVFPLPDDAYRGRMRMVYVVAVAKNVIEEKLNLMRSCYLDPQIIDIEELALRNIALYLPDVEQNSIALLGMKENNGEIIMFRHEDMYLTLTIEMGMASLQEPEHTDEDLHRNYEVMKDRLIVDIQRSLDYYESQLGKGVTNKIYLLPSAQEGVDVEAILQSNLLPSVTTLDCREFLPFDDELLPSLQEQSHYLSVIGAVLRRVA